MTTESHRVFAIDPRIDAYGNRARSGALADFVEVSALLGNSMTQADFADVVGEQDWERLSRRVVIATADDAEADPAEWAEQAFASIAERSDVLGDRYPFVLNSGSVHYAGFAEPSRVPYIALLAITVVHAWHIPCAVEPEVVLEQTVVDALLSKNLRVVGMGTGDRSGTSFVENLLIGGRHVGFEPSSDPRPRASAAKDEGVDTLASLVFDDGRRGQWSFIGQVTCESSAGWMRKLRQPNTETWRGYLQDGLPPQAFLAVPHHIDYQAWDELVTTRTGLLIDRLRICLSKNETSRDEASVVHALLGCVHG